MVLSKNETSEFSFFGSKLSTPDNKNGGISTLEDKSLGCTQKAGNSPIVDVLKYRESKCEKNELEEKMSDVIDDELRIVSNVYGSSFPNFLSLFSDILYHLNTTEKTDLTFDYSSLINNLEYQKLTAGYAALHKMGIPHQPLEKIRPHLKNVNETSVDDVSKAIKLNYSAIDSLDVVDQYFIEAAKL